jgi:hypothetical protein
MLIQSRRRSLLAVGLVVLGGARVAPAADLSWSALDGGFFNWGLNWNLGYLPNADDLAVFDQPGANQTISFNSFLNSFLDTGGARGLDTAHGDWTTGTGQAHCRASAAATETGTTGTRGLDRHMDRGPRGPADRPGRGLDRHMGRGPRGLAGTGQAHCRASAAATEAELMLA